MCLNWFKLCTVCICMNDFTVPQLVYTFLCSWVLNRLRKKILQGTFFLECYENYRLTTEKNACHYIFVYHFKVSKRFNQSSSSVLRISSLQILLDNIFCHIAQPIAAGLCGYPVVYSSWALDQGKWATFQ